MNVCAHTTPKHATGFGICNNLSSSTAHRTTLQVSLQVFLEPLAVPQGGVLHACRSVHVRFHGRASRNLPAIACAENTSRREV